MTSSSCSTAAAAVITSRGASVAVDIARVGNALPEAPGELQDEAAREQTLSGLPTFGDGFPEER